MYQVISFKENNLENFALIELCEDDSVRLLRTLNPDANDGLQGESYGAQWTLSDRNAASKAFIDKGFWPTWTEINGKVSGGIELYDELCDEGAREFMEMYAHPFVFCSDKYDAANAVLSLNPGLYVFYVPVPQEHTQETDDAKSTVVRIGFVNPDTGLDDETEFDVDSLAEAIYLFNNDFCKDNHWKKAPAICYVEKSKEE